jgi:predicted 2-oxoglutarate/Fe(II)-dependent dioxygenase YbiX
MQRHDIVTDRLFTIEEFFSQAECDYYIQMSESMGYAAASVTTRLGQEMHPEIRNNSRVNLDDIQLSENVWQRLQPYIPSPLFNRAAIGLNERWRFYRYEAGQTFKMHQDGSVKRDGSERSLLTFMVYLNADCEGGATRIELANTSNVITIAPRTGTALLFLHTYRHEGAPVTGGLKYVLRSDVMYSAPLQEQL